MVPEQVDGVAMRATVFRRGCYRDARLVAGKILIGLLQSLWRTERRRLLCEQGRGHVSPVGGLRAAADLVEGFSDPVILFQRFFLQQQMQAVVQ